MKIIVLAAALFSSTISIAFAGESDYDFNVQSDDTKRAIQCAALYMEASLNSGHHDPRTPGIDVFDKKGLTSLDLAYHFSKGTDTDVDAILVTYFKYLDGLSRTKRSAELLPMWSTCGTMLNGWKFE